MKNYFLIVFFTICSSAFAQEIKVFSSPLTLDSSAFSVTISSAKVAPNLNVEKQILIMEVTIENKGDKTLTFMPPCSFRHIQASFGWNLLLKNNGIPCKWNEPDKFVSYYPKEIKIKKGKKETIQFICQLEDLDNFDIASVVAGSYTAQLEVTTTERKKMSKQSAKSNIVNLQIQNIKK